VIYKSDKIYFCETLKKLLDERIIDREFIDEDRPIRKRGDIEGIKGVEKEWDNYKKSFEV
jgi:hypothetical protein